MKLKKYSWVLCLAMLLAVCGCGKKKMTVADLPPDPKGCEVFVFDEHSTTWYEDQQKMAEMGCLRKLDQWLRWSSDEEADGDLNELKLSAAIITGNVKEVKKLMASMDIDEEKEEELFGSAVFSGQPEIVKELLKGGTKILLRDGGLPVLRCFIEPHLLLKGTAASDQALLEILHAVVKDGFDVNFRDKKCGRSLWSWPRANNRTVLTQELEKLGFKVTQEDKNFALLLASAIRKADGTVGDMEIVKGLVKEGADVNGKSNCSTRTVYESVKKSGTPEMIELFKSYGAHD